MTVNNCELQSKEGLVRKTLRKYYNKYYIIC